MRTALIIHGIHGNPEENWFPWLRKKLTAKDYRVVLPHFPTKENLRWEDWWEVFQSIENSLGSAPIIVGHSAGAAFALSILEKRPAQAAFLVAPAWGKTDNEFTSLMAPLTDRTFDWHTIRSHCGSFAVYHSDNDPYLPLERGETLAAHLGCAVTLVSGAGHFNASSGYTSFGRLLSDIEKLTADTGKL